MSDHIVCEECGLKLNPTLQSVYQRMTGWVKLRDAGGPNAIKNRMTEPRFRCKGCIDYTETGNVHRDQGSLF